jgi:hypothetical protein
MSERPFPKALSGITASFVFLARFGAGVNGFNRRKISFHPHG